MSEPPPHLPRPTRKSRLLYSPSANPLVGLAVIIWVANTAVAAASGSTAMVATTLLPGISQA